MSQDDTDGSDEHKSIVHVRVNSIEKRKLRQLAADADESITTVVRRLINEEYRQNPPEDLREATP